MEPGPVAEWRLLCARDGREVAPRLRVADRFGSRFWGWMGRRALAPDEALLLVPAGSIHTCFMRVAIDAAFVDRAGRVLRVVRGVRPWRIAWAPRGTWAVVELPAQDATQPAGEDRAAASALSAGDVLALAPPVGREGVAPPRCVASWQAPARQA